MSRESSGFPGTDFDTGRPGLKYMDQRKHTCSEPVCVCMYEGMYVCG